MSRITRTHVTRAISYLKMKSIKITILLTFIVCVWPDRYAKHYHYISGNELYEHLIEQTTRNVSLLNNIYCDYAETIAENKFMYRNPYVDDLIDGTDIKPGGEYLPLKCSPKFSTAIIVAYRQREEQLRAFLTYMHNYLRKQQIHYRIFIVEQFDQKAFNRAMLFNIGVLQAIQHGFPCVVLHDVDLMPLRLGNLYACSRQPRHMSSSLDKFRYNLPYRELFGGAVAIETNVYRHVNGMSNMVSILFT